MKINVWLMAAVIALLICPGCKIIAADTPSSNSRLYQGLLQVMIADDFKRQTAVTQYRLVTAHAGAVFRLIFLNGAPEPVLPSGIRVEIRGRHRNGSLNVEELRVLSQE